MDINPQILFSNLRHEKSETTHFHHLRTGGWPDAYATKGGARGAALHVRTRRGADQRARPVRGHPRVAPHVAVQLPGRAADEPGVVLYAVAHCSPRDNYNKKIGRAIAEGRLYSENHV